MDSYFGSPKIVAMASPVLQSQPFRTQVVKDLFESILLASSMDHRGPTFVEEVRGLSHRAHSSL